MTRYDLKINDQRYTRISKAQARKRFAANETFRICPVKMRPGGPFCLDMLVDPANGRTFDQTVSEFCYYNANCHETGTYAAFYVIS